jgi:hypothetical protein
MTPHRRLILLFVLVAGCTSAQRQGTSPAFLMIGSLEAAAGATPATFGGVLASDVVTLVTRQLDGEQLRVPTVFEDVARVEFSLGLKDPGSVAAPSQPTVANFITITRYHVRYLRADGRNVPGIDVPYAFDSAFTLTVDDERRVATFVLVRSQAKQEAPLSALAGGGGAGVISTIAEITFFGADQAGRTVQVQGRIGVSFADWADPEA